MKETAILEYPIVGIVRFKRKKLTSPDNRLRQWRGGAF